MHWNFEEFTVWTVKWLRCANQMRPINHLNTLTRIVVQFFLFLFLFSVQTMQLAPIHTQIAYCKRSKWKKTLQIPSQTKRNTQSQIKIKPTTNCVLYEIYSYDVLSSIFISNKIQTKTAPRCGLNYCKENSCKRIPIHKLATARNDWAQYHWPIRMHSQTYFNFNTPIIMWYIRQANQL